jgi:NAD(P)-dependent dehydrogenase (short-subunit alcohol dehydrogenase family)
MSTLIIGCHTGGIGDAVHDYIISTDNVKDHWFGRIYAPTLMELDVQRQGSVHAYILDHGPFDHIVYSAGLSALEWIKDASRQTMGRLMGVNALGMVDVAAVHETLFPNSVVRFVGIVSDAAHTPMRGSVAYCMSKAAAEMGIRVMARELAPLWTVVGASPGVVDDTGMTNRLAKEIPEFRGWTPEAARAYEDSSSVIGRRVTKQEVAEMVYFALTGPQALNGSILTINGGK